MINNKKQKETKMINNKKQKETKMIKRHIKK